MSSSEQAALLSQPNKKAPTGLRNLCMLLLMLKAGLRVGEVLALLKTDINWEEGKIHVAESGAAKERTLWLDEELVELLKKWDRLRPPESSIFFSTLKGKPLKDRYLREMVKRLSRKAGIKKDVHPHLLRSTFAVNLIRETNDIRLAQNALGHRDASTTQSYIKHLFSEHSMTYYDILGYRRSGIPAEEKPGLKLPGNDCNYNNWKEGKGGGQEEEGKEEGVTENTDNNSRNWGEKEMNGKEKGFNHNPAEPRNNNDIRINSISDNNACHTADRKQENNSRGDHGEQDGAGQQTNPGPETENNGEPAISMEMEPEEETGQRKIPALKCSRCSYILRYKQNCPKCGASFESILNHWRKNV